MSFCLIILAAGNSSRFRSNVGKPYQRIGGKSLIEINLIKAQKFKQIKKIILVYNKKDLKLIKLLKLKNVKLVLGGKSRQQSTLNALKFLINRKGPSKVLIHDVARPNFSTKLLNSIIRNMKNFRSVVPKINIQDAIKQIIDSSKEEYIVSKKRDNLFLTQTPQAFNLKEIYDLHKKNAFSPMVVIALGNLISSKDSQPINKPLEIVTRFFGSLMLFRLLQVQNAPSSMEMTLSGNVTLSRVEQPLKASLPIEFTPSKIVTLLRL